MARKRGFPPALARDVVRISGGAAQAGQHLAAHALNHVAVETRLGQCKLEEIEGNVLMLGQCAQRTGNLVTAGIEPEADGVILDLLVERA